MVEGGWAPSRVHSASEAESNPSEGSKERAGDRVAGDDRACTRPASMMAVRRAAPTLPASLPDPQSPQRLPFSPPPSAFQSPLPTRSRPARRRRCETDTDDAEDAAEDGVGTTRPSLPTRARAKKARRPEAATRGRVGGLAPGPTPVPAPAPAPPAPVGRPRGEDGDSPARAIGFTSAEEP